LHIIKTTAPIPTKFCTLTKTSNTLHEWCKPAYNKLQMADGCHFEKEEKKSSYISSALTDRHEIWHNDTDWSSELRGQLKFQIFEIQDGGQPPSWKIAISQQLFDGHRCTCSV